MGTDSIGNLARLVGVAVLIAACADRISPIQIGATPCERHSQCASDQVCHQRGDDGDGFCLITTAPRCGDGIARLDIALGTVGFEACDDGNTNDNDACTALCELARCGDAHHRLDLNPSDIGFEACDDGDRDDTNSCSNGCALARCGDGIRRLDQDADDDLFEACDDGNAIDSDNCTNGCTMARCGDGIRRSGADAEVCDDGNAVNTDACTDECIAARCGDGLVFAGVEDCDDGNAVDDDDCRNQCIAARCGDGVLRLDKPRGDPDFEVCDDGNEVDNDLCTNACVYHFDLVELPFIVDQSFTVGSPADEAGHRDDETEFQVRFARAFAIGRTEVTQAQFEAVMPRNRSYYVGEMRPVETVSWFDAVTFANAASRANGLQPCYLIDGQQVVWTEEGLDCHGYRLPTEAEWEVAARAGEIHLYSGSNDLNLVAWWSGNSTERQTHPVAQKRANAWGLYDMSGNVYEWVWDRKGAYPSGTVIDPLGPQTGDQRVARGGCWGNPGEVLRVAFRYSNGPVLRSDSVGFRLARTLP